MRESDCTTTDRNALVASFLKGFGAYSYVFSPSILWEENEREWKSLLQNDTASCDNENIQDDFRKAISVLMNEFENRDIQKFLSEILRKADEQLHNQGQDNSQLSFDLKHSPDRKTAR